jgi:hypothetical protein
MRVSLYLTMAVLLPWLCSLPFQHSNATPATLRSPSTWYGRSPWNLVKNMNPLPQAPRRILPARSLAS